ncbi:MAG: PEP-CTERM sorting domain-containing protein [Burkholderiaceae bacterium]
MKYILKAVIFMAALISFSANAATYDFSYTFGDSSSITGSLSGNLNGSFVENISNVHVFLNGTEFSGAPLFSAAWNTATHDWDNTIGAVVSTNAALNNFIFADTNIPTDYNASNYFYFVNDPAAIGHEAFAVNYNTGDTALDNPARNASWSLVAAPVPEPATYATLITGLVLLGVTLRRRRQS